MTCRRLVPLLMVGGCASPAPTTFELSVRLTPTTAEDVMIGQAELELAAVRLRACPERDVLPFTRGFRTSERPRRLALAEGDAASAAFLPTDQRARGFSLPIGPWCAVDVVPEAPLRLLASAGAGTLDLTLTVPPLSLAPDRWGGLEVVGEGRQARVEVADGILELGVDGWLDPAVSKARGGLDVVVVEGDALYEPLLDGLLLAPGGARLYRTADADGLLTDEERAAGPLAEAEVVR